MYGKDDNREASGVSLVVKADFFDQSESISYSTVSSFEKAKDKLQDVLDNKAGSNDAEKVVSQSEDSKQKEDSTQTQKENENESLTLPKLPLYRCIYLDNETGFLKVACRSEWTFYRENITDSSECLSDENLLKRVENYKKTIQEIEKVVKSNLDEIRVILQKIFKANEAIAEEETDIVERILLRLRYLIKHMAFQEEQECRIYYITELRDDLVQVDFEKKWCYIEYPKIKSSIDCIYLATDAVHHKSFFIKALNKYKKNGKSCVRISQNPFRNNNRI